jgi:hypothetical protein
MEIILKIMAVAGALWIGNFIGTVTGKAVKSLGDSPGIAQYLAALVALATMTLLLFYCFR